MGYKLLGNQCSKYLWMSSMLKVLVFLNHKKYTLMKYCFADICSWQSMNWRNPASLNWLLTPKISPSTAIPPKSHEADSNSHLNAFQSCGISLDAEYSSHASVPAALLPAAEQSAWSQSYWLLVPKWEVLCCPLNSASCCALVFLFILVCVACRQLKSPSCVLPWCCYCCSVESLPLAPGCRFSLQFL